MTTNPTRVLNQRFQKPAGTQLANPHLRMQNGPQKTAQPLEIGRHISTHCVVLKNVATQHKNHRNAPMLILFLAAMFQFVCVFPVPGQHLKKVNDRILLKPRGSASESEVAALISGQGGHQSRLLPKVGVRVVELPAARREQALQYFSRNAKVEFAESDTMIPPSFEPNDPFFCYQWHLTNISCTAAWDATSGGGVLVAVLDTGVDSTHPDLVDRLSAGWNTYDDTADTTDVHGHGTAVIGTVGATANNALGGTSVAPECFTILLTPSWTIR